MGRGIAIASPRSGEGKTMVALGILGALRAKGLEVRSAKSGPDYIDPQFLAAASGHPCLSLDSWAMAPERIRALADSAGDLLVIEGAMGLHDGAPDSADALGRGSTADLVRTLGVPAVLVIDVARQAQTAAAVAQGLTAFSSGVSIPAVILNRVGSLRHQRTIERALDASGIPVLGAFPRRTELRAPSRHLGLMQARERPDLDNFLAGAAALAADCVELERLRDMAAPIRPATAEREAIPPIGQNVAVARDDAFSFSYEHLFAAWRRAGSEIHFFSPLADDPPAASADSIYLPGGYPELHAGKIASCERFRAGVREAARRGVAVYGECGGYMVLGRSLIDAEGRGHEMLGLLPVETSFAKPRMRLGYRSLRPYPNPVWPDFPISGHEFHYAREVQAGPATQPLFAAWDSEGFPLPDMGARVDRVMGSFAHVIDRK